MMALAAVERAPPGDPYAAYRFVGGAMALTLLCVALAEWISNAFAPQGRDFIAFWSAARFAVGGQAAAAYDGAALHAAQLAAAASYGGGLPFPYPPAFLLPLLPFAWLPYPAALAAWTAATFAAYLGAVRRMFPHAGWLPLAFPPVLANAAIGQSGFAIAAVFVGGLALLPKRPFAAGLLLGCLVVKPQLALMLPVAMIAGGHRRAIAGAALSSVGMLALGAAAFGSAATAAWVAQLPLMATIARDGLVGWHKLASVYASARAAGLDAHVAWALHAAVAAGAAWAVWRVWRSGATPGGRAAVLGAATMLGSPYLFLYDAGVLVVPLLWLAARGERPRRVAALWCLPMLTLAQSLMPVGPVNLQPLLPVALLVLACRRSGAWGQAAARDRSAITSPPSTSAPPVAASAVQR